MSLALFDPIRHFHTFDFKSCRRVLVAVSGGSDSVGLLLALHDYFQTLPHKPLLCAVTVDHGLRPESKTEAAGVAMLCGALNIPHVIQEWQGAKPLTGIQAAARHERRALIALTASEQAANIVLTGHTLDDQIETVVMRQKRGTGPGLAGIAEASLCFDDRTDGKGIWFVRPFLNTWRTDIRSYLTARGVDWVDDPSNDNPAFERIAIRQDLNAENREKHDELVRIRDAAATQRKRLSSDAANLVRDHVQEVVPGLVRIGPEAFGANHEILAVLLRTLIAFSGGANALGDGRAAAAIAERLRRFEFARGAMPWRETSNGALIDVRHSGVYLLRDGRKQRPGLRDFDGRYRATATGRPVQFFQQAGQIEGIPASLVNRATALEPVFQTDEKAQMSAHTAAQSGHPLRKLVNPWPDLVPYFDFELANSLSEVAGAGSLVALPVDLSAKK